MNLSFLKDPHTYVVVAMFLAGGLTALQAGLTPGTDLAGAVSAILGVLAIFIKQNPTTTV